MRKSVHLVGYSHVYT